MSSPFGLLYLITACWLGYTAIIAYRRGELEVGDDVESQKITKDERPRAWRLGVVGLAVLAVALLGLSVYSFMRDIR
jgi:hypothetical protein